MSRTSEQQNIIDVTRGWATQAEQASMELLSVVAQLESLWPLAVEEPPLPAIILFSWPTKPYMAINSDSADHVARGGGFANDIPCPVGTLLYPICPDGVWATIINKGSWGT